MNAQGADKGGVEEPISHHFVTAMIKGDTGAPPGHWAIKGADAQAGDLKVAWHFHLSLLGIGSLG